ncbi:uncharacterized protein [Haliotis cracherodii]|uniref:uncharacterized protein n=1 Tax=Haliotis cracherodii TaxID=6455 RepID=UPI0039ECA67E
MIFHSYFVLYMLSVLSAADECVKVGTCTCNTSTRTINLNPLSANTGPRFTIPGIDSDKYFYNPCKDITEGGSTGVMIQQQGGVYYVTGDDNTATFSGDPDLGTLTLSYQHAESGIIRNSKVKLVCMEGTNQLIFNGEDPKLNYQFTLNTGYVCPQKTLKFPLYFLNMLNTLW